MPQLLKAIYEGLPSLVYENRHLQLTILPSLGAKVISLKNQADGYEYLWRQPDRPLVHPDYAAVFTDYDISGWDECFPSINPVSYPSGPWHGTQVPDHGEVWALPWHWEYKHDSLVMWVYSVRFSYRFQRTFSLLSDGTLAVTYQVTNLSPFPFQALWSMHPFLRVTPESRVLLPTNTRMLVEASDNNHIGGFLAEAAWPVTTDSAGQPEDLSLLGPQRKGTNSKLYTKRLSEGWAALYEPSGGHYLAFDFDPLQIPYVGVCTLRGGWPSRGAEAFTLLLEPCKGWPDSLDIAAARGDSFTIAGDSQVEWHVNLRFGCGQANLERIIGNMG
ncbi:MAG: aldose epimerase family protein [Anaerolineae bacterium]